MPNSITWLVLLLRFLRHPSEARRPKPSPIARPYADGADNAKLTMDIGDSGPS